MPLKASQEQSIRHEHVQLTRSELMARVRSKNTGPELLVRRALWAAGIRYRLHYKNLPGCPDLVLAGQRTVVFVHGCFWHRHDGCPRNRTPKSRVEWWTAKFARNTDRDAEARALLEASGWRVLVIWECEAERTECLAVLIAELEALRSKAIPKHYPNAH